VAPIGVHLKGRGGLKKEEQLMRNKNLIEKEIGIKINTFIN